MKVQPECFPCILGRVLAIARRITDDPWLQHKVLGKVMAELADANRDSTPAELVATTYAHVVKTLGATDPFQKDRDHWFQELSGVEERIAAAIERADDPLLRSLSFSARANVFDDETLTRARVQRDLAPIASGDDEDPETLSDGEDYAAFLQDLEGANSLLFIHDSGPELVLDRHVIDQLASRRPELEITSVVRAQPILLDATREDAERVGLHEHSAIKGIVDPGTTSLGCPPNTCTREFRETLESSDVVLAKGQAALETLSGIERRVYFLLRVKCGVMASSQGAKRGDTLLLRG